MFYINKHFQTDPNPLNIQDRGFLLGDGLFETLRADNKVLKFFDAHYERLAHSADFLKIPLTDSKTDLRDICEALLEKNALHQTAALRITLTRGLSERGIGLPKKSTPTLLVTANAYTPPTSTITACLSNISINEQSPLTQHKTLNYLDNILARQIANENGCDEAILLNTQGRLVSTSIGNLFIEIEGQLITPPLSEGALPGIRRAQHLKDYKAKGTPCLEKPITAEDIQKMTHAFHTNSLIDKQAIRKLSIMPSRARNCGSSATTYRNTRA